MLVRSELAKSVLVQSLDVRTAPKTCSATQSQKKEKISLLICNQSTRCGALHLQPVLV